MAIVLTYVDDILLTGSSTQICQAIITALDNLFPVKDLGDAKYFLVLELHRTNDALYITESKYIVDLLRRAKMDGAKPSSTLISTSLTLDNTSGNILPDPFQFRSLVEGLQYLIWTRPDISFSVNQVCQFLKEPRTHHLIAVKRILRYLKDTANMGLVA